VTDDLLAEVLANSNPKRGWCTVAQALAHVDADLGDQFAGLFARAHDHADVVTYAAVAKALSSRSGVAVKGNTLSRHIRGGCACD